MEAKNRAGCSVLYTLQSLEKFFGEAEVEGYTIVDSG
jgi:hypothetical protein